MRTKKNLTEKNIYGKRKANPIIKSVCECMRVWQTVSDKDILIKMFGTIWPQKEPPYSLLCIIDMSMEISMTENRIQWKGNSNGSMEQPSFVS